MDKDTEEILGFLEDLAKISAKRSEMENLKQEQWELVKAFQCDKSKEIAELASIIGECTHTINMILNYLSTYGDNELARSITIRYLKKEQERVDEIIKNCTRLIDSVEEGKDTIISSQGKISTDTQALAKYVCRKKKQSKKLKEWLKFISL